MTPVDLLGWFAAALGTTTFVPQLVHLLRAGTSAGVSLVLWQLNVAGSLAWAAHGFSVLRPQLMWPNAILFLGAVSVVVLVSRYRGLAIVPRLAWPLALGAALFGLDVLAGAGVFGLVVAVPGAIGTINQFLEMRGSRDLGGVAVGYLALNAAMQALWWTWGILATEWAIIGCASVLSTLAVVNLSYYLHRTLRSPATDATPVAEPAH